MNLEAAHVAVDGSPTISGPPRAPRFYAPELDGLRFIAALLVFAHHSPEIPMLHSIKQYGWVGVDLFLTISAFLITRLICLEYESSKAFDFKAFLIRRALRIWPLYLFFATAMCLWGAVRGVGGRVALEWWLSHISLSNNVMTAVHGYSPVPFTPHLWTISLEEQAYVILPLLLLAFCTSGAHRKTALWFAAGALAILTLARAALVLADTPHPFIWVLPLRADAFILGALAAILFRSPVRSALPAFAAGGVLLMSAMLFQSIDVVGPGQVFGFTLVALGCLGIVLVAQAEWVGKVVLTNPASRYLGKISYGIYVYHLGAIGLVSKLEVGPISAFVVGLIVTVAIAAVSYRFLERPFLLLKDRYAKVASRPV